MRAKVQRWGNSLAVRIPKSFADEVGLSAGAPVEMRLLERGLIVEPIRPGGPSLDELLARVTPDNVHGEVETGPPRGAEGW